MSWLVDGSNVLGRDRESDDAKRRFVQQLARFARTRRTKVACFFDGLSPSSFGSSLGGVSVVFTGQRPADDLIVQRVSAGTGWKVVTSDQGLASRVRGRRCEVVRPASFLGELEALPDESPAGSDDWQAYFSDPKNRNVF